MKFWVVLILISFLNVASFAASFTYGSYTGTGSSQSITGVGFTPGALLIKANGSYAGVVATSSMTAGDARKLTGTAGLETGLVTTIDANGFTVATANETNKSGTSYYFVAWEDDGSLDVGSYTGDPGSVSVGYRPAMVWVLGDEGSWPDYAAFALDGASSSFDFNFGGTTSDYIGSFTATGFNVGADLNTTAKIYHYVTFKNDVDVTESSYTGTNSAGEEITTPGASQQFVLAKSGLNENGWFKTRSMAIVNSSKFNANAATSNAITGFTDNGFELGTNSEVNGSAKTIYYYASKGGNVLPVELIYFKANKSGTGVKIQWETASEINSSHFLIERSTDGHSFEVIGEISAAGSSTTPIEYEYYDYQPDLGNNYYRLKQIDFDNAFEYFNTVVVNGKTGTEMTHVNLYPNPVLDELNLYFDSRNGGVYNVKVFNQLGVEVDQATVYAVEGGNEVQINIMSYDAGYYIANLYGPNEEAIQLKFYKRN